MRHDWEFLDMPGKEHWYCHRCGGKSPTDHGHGGYCKPDWAWHEAQRYKAAGNTGRHTTAIGEPHPSSMIGLTAESDGLLWNRLRADMNNLGAAYGELPTTSDDYWSCGYCQTAGIRSGDECECGPAMTAQSVPTTLEIVTLGLDGNYVSPATSQRRDSEPVDNLSPTDRNAYFDGIILAARKKREALAWMDEPLTDDERDICHAMWDEQDRAEKVSAAMSRPLTFEPRVGWKGGPSDE